MSEDPTVLQGWTAIRSYLRDQGVRVNTRTLQTWKKDHGLPVRRNALFREVYADPIELTEWILRELMGKD